MLRGRVSASGADPRLRHGQLTSTATEMSLRRTVRIRGGCGRKLEVVYAAIAEEARKSTRTRVFVITQVRGRAADARLDGT